MSTAIMQTGAMGWDYKFHDWNDSNDVADIQLKVSIFILFNSFEIYDKQLLWCVFDNEQCVSVSLLSRLKSSSILNSWRTNWL